MVVYFILLIRFDYAFFRVLISAKIVNQVVFNCILNELFHINFVFILVSINLLIILLTQHFILYYLFIFTQIMIVF